MQIVQMVFPGGKSKAFTTSYDDGVKQDKRLLALMNQYGVRGTFNLNFGTLGRNEHAVIDGFDTDVTTFHAEDIAEIYQGHEVAAHALTHKKLTDISTGVAVYEVIEDRRNLEQVLGQFVTGFAYPFGVYDSKVQQVLRDCGIRYARTVKSTHEFQMPSDFLAWHPTCHHNDEKLMELLERFCTGDGLFGEPQLFYLWGHAYEFDQRDNWDVAERAFTYVNRYQDKIWFATNGEICEYIEAFHKIEFSVDGTMVQNKTAVDVWILVDGKVISVPAGKQIKLT